MTLMYWWQGHISVIIEIVAKKYINWDKTEQMKSLKQHCSKFSLYSTGMFTTNLSISEPKEFHCFHRQHRTCRI